MDWDSHDPQASDMRSTIEEEGISLIIKTRVLINSNDIYLLT